MRNLTAVWLIFLILALAAGCRAEQSPPGSADNLSQADKGIALAGIYLGDSAERVEQVLGSEYAYERFEESGYFGEPISHWTYGSDVEIIMGEETGKVLQLKLGTDRYAAGSGHKVGDRADTILDEFQDRYPAVQSRHEDRELPGWFVVADGIWLIFNFQDSQVLVNAPLAPHEPVQSIHLVYERFMD